MATLPTRKIGNDDVAAMGLGLLGLSAFYGQLESDEERFKFLDVALEEGATCWDTADVYATKFGIFFTETGRGVNGKPEYAKSACAKSLKRLGVEQIDLYYLHKRADPTVPIEPADPSMINRQKTVSAMAELVKEGKVRYLGLSEVSSATLRRAHAVHPITAVQVEYSPFTLDIEDDKIALLKTCRELGVAVIAYSPLGRGLLTGQYKSPDDFEEGDFRRGIPKFSSKENFTKILQLVDGLAEIGKKYNATAGQITLSWIFAQGKDIIPIPGTKKIKYLKENLASIHIKLTDEDERKIRKLAEDSEILGQDRYPPHAQAELFIDTVPL
ncbi:Aldo-keto reductase yakc [NADP(+)] [Leucoagaricus sp. SymC.cos]|nr:Aldo-keto reductase yakc [NADP(+)] [Leucoagaricus sp. SymC.cos]